ncbi:MAG: hypothetical protein JWN34_5522 [Bryobacterales bacterium]|nr:hypothetical protein [Bryobacterales bacterium]
MRVLPGTQRRGAPAPCVRAARAPAPEFQDRERSDTSGRTALASAAARSRSCKTWKIAVKAKYARLKAGFYGTDNVAREWRKQMARILSQLQEMRPEHRA